MKVKLVIQIEDEGGEVIIRSELPVSFVDIDLVKKLIGVE